MRLSQAQKSVLWLVLAALVLGGAALALTVVIRDGPGVSGTIAAQPRITLRDDAQGADPAADLPIEQFLPNEVLALDAQDAMARNLALPVARGPNPVAPAFVAQWLGAGLADATKCLAAAVYYEAAGEPIAGQRAVAQVVLNRLRNPRYPKTICDVVYQGAERPTGCQFSFACDGSTRRVPGAAGWSVATAVATSVLNGVTSAEAGQATHYHTLAVFPAWAPQLAKIGIIGHHIFYRPPGRATFGYDAIAKAPPADPLLADTPPVVLPGDPAPRPIGMIDAPATTAPANAGRVGAAASLPQAGPAASGAGQSGSADPGRPAVAAGERSPAAAPVDPPRRSMFPTRRTGVPNLPLAADH